jgi:hypothetical protein
VVWGCPSADLYAGRADNEGPLGDAAPALNTGPQTMELRHLRYADRAGVRFVALNGESPVLTTAIVSPRHTEHLPTVAFLRAASRTLEQRPPIASERSVLAA